MMRQGALFWHDRKAAAAAEFALVLPLALLFLLGIIDAGRYAWAFNQVEKGAQMGVRMAVVTTPVEGGLRTLDLTNSTACNGGVALTAGDSICRAAFGTLSCTSSSCSCTSGPCLGSQPSSYQTAAFTNILGRVRQFAPMVQAANLTVEYRGSGIGFASDPEMDIAPLVTVRLQSVPFTSVSLLGTSFALPSVSRTLLMEDGLGTQSN